MMKINMYVHAGSDNHGCEALAVSISNIFGKDTILFSGNKEVDLKYGVSNYCIVKDQGIKVKPYSYYHIFSKFISLIFKNINMFYERIYCNVLKSSGIFLQIGGDNYCYGNSYKMLDYLNKKIKQRPENISILFGASIEQEIIENDYQNLGNYDLIIARESVTYHNLLKYLPKDKVKLYPDPAFILPIANINVPQFCEGAIGINISPMILEYAENAEIVLKNYKHLMKDILEKTDKNIILVPHVVNRNTDDRTSIQILYKEFRDSERVYCIEDASCVVLKKYISVCSTFIGARTHATIAAYSTGVPTLVVGYSVKSKGIAVDLFGTDQHYVVSVNELKTDDQLTQAYWWIEKNRKSIEVILANKIPQYITKIKKIKVELENL